MSAIEEDCSLTFADKINQAFATMHRPGEDPPTNREVANWLAENSKNGEPTLSENYIGLLRRGFRTNPTLHTLQALARFFEVPVGYFAESGSAAKVIHEELQLVASLRDAKVRGIAARAASLDSEMRSWLHDFVNTLPGGRPLGKQRDQARLRSFEVPADEDLDAW